jgi:PAT family beta-lactamase induction signal transducer AmpG
VWKFLWSPLVDRYPLRAFGLGRRRGWMLATQLVLLAAIVALGQWRPASELDLVIAIAAIVAFFSATQDIVLDAYRRELLPDVELGLGNAVHIQTYRLSGLIPGALALVLADHLAWEWVFTVIAAFMLVGIALTLTIEEVGATPGPGSLRAAIVEPFREYVGRRGVKSAALALFFLFFYKLGDSMATALSTPFYIDLGFSLTEIGLIAKNAALWPSIIGGILGGLWMLKLGIDKALWVFGLVQLVTILGFAVLAEVGNDPWLLAVVISLEYLGVGLGTAAFVAFIARETSPALAATQIALFTALTALPRTLANALTGLIVEGGGSVEPGTAEATLFALLQSLGLPDAGLGWTHFFYFCTVMGLPGMVLLWWVAPIGARSRPPAVTRER